MSELVGSLALALATKKSAGTSATRKEVELQQSWPNLTLTSATTAPHSHETNETMIATAPTKVTKPVAGENATADAPGDGDAAATDATDATHLLEKCVKNVLTSTTPMTMV